jgi:hypothetical protein
VHLFFPPSELHISGSHRLPCILLQSTWNLENGFFSAGYHKGDESSRDAWLSMRKKSPSWLVAHCHRRTNQRSLRQGHCYFQGTSWFESAVSTGPLVAGCRMTGVQQQRGKVSGGSTQQTQLQQHSCTPPNYIIY